MIRSGGFVFNFSAAARTTRHNSGASSGVTSCAIGTLNSNGIFLRKIVAHRQSAINPNITMMINSLG